LGEGICFNLDYKYKTKNTQAQKCLCLFLLLHSTHTLGPQ
jgi:hypothetical protein